MSDRMKRLRLMTPPPPRPWTVRPASMERMFGATAQMMLPMVKKVTDPKNIACRPKASAIAAMIGWHTAFARR